MSSLSYVPILVFLIIAFVFPFALLIFARFLRPDRPEAVKLENYECGLESDPEVRGRYSVHFYILAVLFVVFDVETIFLFPWAVQFNVLGLFGLIEMGVFLVILLVAYAYAWRKGALQWV
jgi:NADH-quinone oxidoreductase subunit A